MRWRERKNLYINYCCCPRDNGALWGHERAVSHTYTHIYMYTQTHTLSYCCCSGQFREKQQWVSPPLWSGHIGLRAIVCVLSTSKIRPKVGPNVWLQGLCAEWTRGTGDTIMALAWVNRTIVLETLMVLVGSVWAGLSSSNSSHRPWYWRSTIWGSADRHPPVSPESGSPQTGNTLTSSDSRLLTCGHTKVDRGVGPEITYKTHTAGPIL